MNIGNLKFPAHDGPAILVTVTQDLCIMVPATANEPAVYVDVPLPNVTDIDIEGPGNDSRTLISQQRPKLVLRVRLARQSGHTFYLNASPQSNLEIVLLLDSAVDATDLRSWILEARAVPRVSESQELIESSEDVASAEELHATSAKRGMRALDQEHNTPPSSNAIAAVEERMSPEELLNSTQQPSRDTTGGNRASTSLVAIFTGAVNVQAGIQSCGSLSHVNRPVQHSSAAAAFARQSDEFSEQGLTSSAQWTKGLKVIDTAPELQVKVSEPRELTARVETNDITFTMDIASTGKEASAAAAVERYEHENFNFVSTVRDDYQHLHLSIFD